MAECTREIKALGLSDGQWAHLGVKVFTLGTQIATLVSPCTMSHELLTPLGMTVQAPFPTNTMFTLVILIVPACWRWFIAFLLRILLLLLSYHYLIRVL